MMITSLLRPYAFSLVISIRGSNTHFSFSTSSNVGNVNLKHRLVWSVNWDNVSNGLYAVVDPNDSTSLLYLNADRYLDLTMLMKSKGSSVIVIATPGDTKPLDSEIVAPRPGSKMPPRPSQSRAFLWRAATSSIRKAFWSNFNSDVRALEVVRWQTIKDAVVQVLSSRDKAPYPALSAPSIRWKAKYLNLSSLLGKWSKVLALWLHFPLREGKKLEAVSRLSKIGFKVLKSQGPRGLVLYLKCSMLTLQQYLAGTPVKSFHYGYGIAVRRGLPSWIPHQGRSAIRSKSQRVIRYYMSLCYAYRCIEVPMDAMKALSTITAAPLKLTADVDNLLSEYRQFLKDVFIPSIGGARRAPQWEWKVFTPCSAGPSGAPAILTAVEDSILMQKECENNSSIWQAIVNLDRAYGAYTIDRLKTHFKEVSSTLVGDTPMSVKPFKATPVRPSKSSKLLSPPETESIGIRWNLLGAARMQSNLPRLGNLKPETLSKVFIFPEPGAKVRAVAIIDIFSQRYLKPLHDDIFSILKKIPQDGTMDQVSLFKSLATLMSGVDKYVWSSLDLSSATDMIPKEVYLILLQELYAEIPDYLGGPNTFAQSVMTLLTDRTFKVSTAKGIDCSNLPSTVRYTRGQPMGALSSFALLALWHHSWVQFAAWKLNPVLGGKALLATAVKYYPLVEYGVTGDDVVIAERSNTRPIAQSYISLSRTLGIPISLPKSFVSSSLFNFLSRVQYRDSEISPASLREEFQIVDTPSRISRVMRLAERGWIDLGSSSWLAKAVKLFMYPAEYALHVKDMQNGTLSSLGQRAILSLLSPNRSVLQRLGFSGYPIMGWLAALASSPSLVGRGVELREGKFLPHLKSMSKTQVLSEILDELSSEVQNKITELNAKALISRQFLGYMPIHLRGSIRTLFLPAQLPIIPEFPRVKMEAPQGLDLSKLTSLDDLSFEIISLAINETLDTLQELVSSIDYSNPFTFSDIAVARRTWSNSMDTVLSSHEKRVLSLLFKLIPIATPRGEQLLSQYSKFLLRKYSE